MLFLLAGASSLFAAGLNPGPPTTRRDDLVDDYFGTKVADPYRWLEDQNSPETRAWIAVQDSYSRPILDGLSGRDILRQRLTALMNVDVIGVPFERG